MGVCFLLRQPIPHLWLCAWQNSCKYFTLQQSTKNFKSYTWKNYKTDITNLYNKHINLFWTYTVFLKTIKCNPNLSSFTEASIVLKDEKLRLKQCQLIPKILQQMSNRATTRIQISYFQVTLFSNISLSTNKQPTLSSDNIHIMMTLGTTSVSSPHWFDWKFWL